MTVSNVREATRSNSPYGVKVCLHDVGHVLFVQLLNPLLQHQELCCLNCTDACTMFVESLEITRHLLVVPCILEGRSIFLQVKDFV